MLAFSFLIGFFGGGAAVRFACTAASNLMSKLISIPTYTLQNSRTSMQHNQQFYYYDLRKSVDLIREIILSWYKVR